MTQGRTDLEGFVRMGRVVMILPEEEAIAFQFDAPSAPAGHQGILQRQRATGKRLFRWPLCPIFVGRSIRPKDSG
jgi:hypothetical protein